MLIALGGKTEQIFLHFKLSSTCTVRGRTANHVNRFISHFAPWTHPLPAHMSPVLLHGVLLLRG
jgi:hypothetical protein